LFTSEFCQYILYTQESDSQRPPLTGVTRGRNQLFISGGGNFHEISFDDVIVLLQPRCNFFANGHM